MKINKKSIVRRLRDRQRGQSLVLITVALVALLGLAALAIDVGRLYYGYQELLTATQAAALAGGGVMSNDGETVGAAENEAQSYSALSGDANAATSGLLTNVKISATVKCLTSAVAVAAGVPACGAYSIGDYNAMAVTETAIVPTTFARVFGIDSWPIGVTELASAKGGFNGPYNVEIITDTTSSMTDLDSDSNCNSERITCALSGVQTLLSTLSPCAAGSSGCPSATDGSATIDGVEGSGSPPYTATYSQGSETAANVTPVVDEAGLMVFPGLDTAADVTKYYPCPKSTPTTIVPYNDGPVYQVVPLSSDYRTTDSSSTLNTSSNLVIAAGGTSGCKNGAGAWGGKGSFAAGAIDTAQANLVANARSHTQNVIILLSDGQFGNGTMTPGTKTNYSATNQCNQAVASAQAAAKAGTWVYAVAYGAESGSCTDSETTPIANITPCETMENIASSPGNYPDSTKFFSDYTATGGTSSCIGRSQSDTNLNDIFKQIGGDFTVSRLLPAGTT